MNGRARGAAKRTATRFSRATRASFGRTTRSEPARYAKSAATKSTTTKFAAGKRRQAKPHELRHKAVRPRDARDVGGRFPASHGWRNIRPWRHDRALAERDLQLREALPLHGRAWHPRDLWEDRGRVDTDAEGSGLVARRRRFRRLLGGHRGQRQAGALAAAGDGEDAP